MVEGFFARNNPDRLHPWQPGADLIPPPKPVLSGLAPTSGPVGSSVVLTGTGLTGTTSVRFGSVNAPTFTVTSDTSVRVTVPVGASTSQITLSTPGGTASTATFTVTVAPAAPTLSAFTPTSGSAGSSVVLSGTHLSGATAVRFGTLNAPSFTVTSDTSITVTVPVGAATGTLSVVTPGGTATSSGSFIVTAAPPSAAGYGGTTGWTLFHTYNLTVDEGPWAQTNGVRSTDASFNRAAQTSFGPGGMTITAERASDTAQIFSSDAQARYAPLPDYFALEADVNLADYVGVGMFPALWWRPAVGGKGEIDGFEYCGAYIGQTTPNGGREMKMTVIETTGGTPYLLGQDQRGFGARKANPPWNGTFAGFHRWRWEKTPGLVSVWVDGIFIDSISRATLDAQAGAGAWDTTIEYGGTWYTRLTYQVGPGSASNLAGSVPAGWRSSRLIVSRMVAYSKG